MNNINNMNNLNNLNNMNNLNNINNINNINNLSNINIHKNLLNLEQFLQQTEWCVIKVIETKKQYWVALMLQPN